MTARLPRDTWVEIHRIVLEQGQRAPQVPADTQQVPLEMTVKGFLLHEAAIGEEVRIRTAAGRTLTGTLTAVNPAYTHQYGPPIPELLPIGHEVRAILREKGIVQ